MKSKKPNFRLRQLLTNIYGMAFTSALVFLFPVYALLFVNHGISEQGVSALFMIWSLSVIITQLPVAVAAQKFSRKSIVVFGQIIKIAGFALWMIWPTFWGFAAGFFLLGLQWAIYDAVFESLVYEELKHIRQRNLYTKICGRKAAIEMIAYLLTTVGSVMLVFGYEFVSLVSLVPQVISVFFAVRIKSAAPNPTGRNAISAFVKTLKLSRCVIKKSKYLLYLLILVSAVLSITVIDDYFGLVGTDMGMPEYLVGSIFIMAAIANSIGNAIAPRFEKIGDRAIYIGIIILGALLVGLSVFWTLPGLAFLGAMFFLQGVLKVLVFAKFQHSIASNCRTMFLSLLSMSGNIICIIMYFFIGLGTYAGGGGFRYSMLFLGIAYAALGLWALAFIKKENMVSICDNKLTINS